MAHGQSNRLRPAGLLASLAWSLGLLAGCHSAEKKDDPTKSLDPATKQKLLGYAPATGTWKPSGTDRSAPSSLPAPQLGSATKPPPAVAVANPTPTANTTPTYSMPTSPVNPASMSLQRASNSSRPDVSDSGNRSGAIQPFNPASSASPAIIPPAPPPSSSLPAFDSSASPSGPIHVPAMPVTTQSPTITPPAPPASSTGPLPTIPGNIPVAPGSSSTLPPVPTSIPGVSGLNPPSSNAGSIASQVIPAPPLQNLSIPPEPPPQTLPPVVPLGPTPPALPTDIRESNYPPIPSPTDFPPAGK